MANSTVALFMIHANRFREAFQALIRGWEGILVSDGHGVYCKWVTRQSCLAYLFRKASELSERKDPGTARFGSWALSDLQGLCHMAHGPPTIGEWRALYARLNRLITLHRERSDAAGNFARRLEKELDCLWLFLVKEGVAPTNNHAERRLRFAVLWRKRSQGTASEKGNRWLERILSLRQNCRLRSRNLFHTLVDALDACFRGHNPDLARIAKL